MKLRSKDIVNAIFAAFGYRLEPIRNKNTPNALASDPYLAQQEIIRRLSVLDPIIYDVGANKGDTADIYRNLFPNATIHCFEPFPDTLNILTQRFAHDERVRIVPKAISTQQGTTTFYTNHAAATNSLLPRPEDSKRMYPQAAGPKGQIEVETIDLVSYTADAGADHINILKLDIQGGELLAIEGAKDLLESQRVDLIYCEIQCVPLYKDAAQFDGVWSTLRSLGYALFDIYDLHRSAGGQVLYGDAMFVSQRVRAEIIDRLGVDG